MVEQPPSSTARELSEYLSRQFDRLNTAINGVVNATVNTSMTLGRMILNGPWNPATNDGQLFLNGASGNRIEFNGNGPAAPSFTTRSTGTRLSIVPLLSGTTVADVAIGYESNALWFSMPTANSAYSFKWYGGTTLAAGLKANGDLSTIGAINTSSPTAGIGYATGSGGSVTQATSKATTVTLNRVCGIVTTASDALAAGAVVSFTFNNSSWHSDHMLLNTIGGNDGAYNVGYASVSDGVVRVWIKNISAGSLSQAIPIIFTIIKSVSS
jgi:hypothetical protein